MFSSKKDMEGFAALVFALTIVGVLIYGVLYFLNISIPFGLIAERMFTKGYIEFFNTANTYLLIPLGIDLVIYALASLINKR
jgi:hypothetical protein